jgi:hypothetical protein
MVLNRVDTINIDADDPVVDVMQDDCRGSQTYFHCWCMAQVCLLLPYRRSDESSSNE